MFTWNELNKMLDENDGIYINTNNILFTNQNPGILIVNAPWSQDDDFEDVSIVCVYNDPNEFFQNLHMEHLSQIDQVQPETLLKLFHAGQAMVVCSTGDEQSLDFEKNGEDLYASPGSSIAGHQVLEKLSSPKEFAEYTRQYFHSIKVALSPTN